MNAQNERIFRFKPSWRAVLWLSVCGLIGAVVLSLYMVVLDLHSFGQLGGRFVFVFAAFFFAYLAFITIRSLLRNMPLLRISRQGIEDCQFGFALIPWQDVIAAEVNVQMMRGFPYTTLYLKVENQENYFGRFSFGNRLCMPLHSWRKKLIPLDFTHLDGRVDEAVEWIETFRPGIPIEYTS